MEYTQEAYPPQTGFQHIVLQLWSTVDAFTDADSIVRSTTNAVSRTGSVASYRSWKWKLEFCRAHTPRAAFVSIRMRWELHIDITSVYTVLVSVDDLYLHPTLG